MFIIVQFNFNIDITSGIAFYEDFDVNLMRYLREIYEGSCINGCLIVRIYKITRIGECQFLSATNPCQGSLGVSFTARVVHYSPGDVIGGCIARETSSGSDRIPALTPLYAEIIFARDIEAGARDDALSVIGAGATIIGNARITMANPGASRISIQATLYSPPTEVRYWLVSRVDAESIQWTSPQYWIPSELRKNGEDSEIYTIVQYMTELRNIWKSESTESEKIVPRLAQNVSKLFVHVMRSSRAKVSGESTSLVLDLTDTKLRNIAAVAVYPEDDPFLCKVHLISREEDIPADWKRDRPGQSRDIVMTQCTEYFANIHIAAIETLRALLDPKCATATKPLIIAQMNLAKK